MKYYKKCRAHPPECSFTALAENPTSSKHWSSFEHRFQPLLWLPPSVRSIFGVCESIHTISNTPTTKYWKCSYEVIVPWDVPKCKITLPGNIYAVHGSIPLLLHSYRSGIKYWGQWPVTRCSPTPPGLIFLRTSGLSCRGHRVYMQNYPFTNFFVRDYVPLTT